MLKAEIAADEEAIDEMDGVISGFQRKADEEGERGEVAGRRAARMLGTATTCPREPPARAARATKGRKG